MKAALRLHQEGKLVEAENAYRAIRMEEPGHFLASYNLGIVLVQQGRTAEGEPFIAEATYLSPDILPAQIVHGGILSRLDRPQDAVAVFDKVLARDPVNREALNDRANALMRMTLYPEALDSLGRLLALDPAHAIALYNRASISATLGRPAEALHDLEAACAAKAGFGEALFFKGNLLRDLGRMDDALAAFEAALAITPRSHDCLNNLGDVLSTLGRFDEALTMFDAALTITPRNPDIMVNRGRALGKLGRTEDQIAAYDQALAIKPGFVPALVRLGVTYFGLRRYDEALRHLDLALAQAPQDPKVLEARGNVLMMIGRREEAVASYEGALAIQPTAEALNNYGHVLRRMSRYEDAARAYEQALKLKPDFPFAKGYQWAARLYCCDWTNLTASVDAMVNETLAGQLVTNPFGLVQFSNSAPAQLEAARLFVSAKKRTPQPWAPTIPQAARQTPRVRVAYLSADLQNHATAFLMAGMFEAHDRSRFETVAISFARDDAGHYRPRLRNAFDSFIDASTMTDGEVVTLARELSLDIAVDLKGFTNDARPEIFIDRIAPLQVSFLGYPGTWGAPCMDYLIADPRLVPPEHEAFYSEKIVRLPDSYQPNDRNREIAVQAPTRAEAGLPAEGFVFCSFNNTYKILPPVFDIWMRLLKAIPGSVLWLLGANEAATRNLRREAATRGVAPERLVFAPVAAPPAHLARQRLADLFLDTLPCTAHTTASDALWAGLPLLTCLGDTFAGRVAASLLTAAGLPELITRSLEEYESMALMLASTPDVLRGFKDKLTRERMSCALFDTQRFCRHLEAAYLTMWERQQRGQPPATFDVPSA